MVARSRWTPSSKVGKHGLAALIIVCAVLAVILVRLGRRPGPASTTAGGTPAASTATAADRPAVVPEPVLPAAPPERPADPPGLGAGRPEAPAPVTPTLPRTVKPVAPPRPAPAPVAPSDAGRRGAPPAAPSRGAAPRAPVTAEPRRVAPEPAPRVAPPPPAPAPVAPAPSAPSAAPAAPPAAAAPVPVFDRESAALAQLLDQYELAYQRLDAGAAAAVWPSVDVRALSRAFARLRMQDLQFGDCTFAIAQNEGTARCAGVLRYAPRIGDSTPRLERHVWTIEFARAGEVWRIARMTAQ